PSVKPPGFVMPISASDWNETRKPVVENVRSSSRSLTPIAPPSLCMLPGWMSPMRATRVLDSVAVPTVTLANSGDVATTAGTDRSNTFTTMLPGPSRRAAAFTLGFIGGPGLTHCVRTFAQTALQKTWNGGLLQWHHSCGVSGPPEPTEDHAG